MNDVTRLLQIDDPRLFKIHAARWNQERQPLDVFLADREDWFGWTAWFNGRHEWNRPYVLSLMDFYHERDIWLFGGILRVNNFNHRPAPELAQSRAYDVELCEKGADLIGRLKVRLPISNVRNVKLVAENWLDSIELVEILRRPYTGPGFAGYDRASLLFSDLVSIVTNDRQDWKTALANMKGVYLITLDDGRNYVGSAYGDIGLWSRWSSYALTRHGGNAQMRQLCSDTNGTFIEGARFTLVEAWPTRTEDRLIIERESYWKNALMSRRTGVNLN